MFFTTAVVAQDIHYTQFFHAPANYNPAHTGDFDGDYRVVANQRRQWASVTIPYQTFAASVDANNFLKNEGLGTLLSFQTDKTGDSHFSTTQINLGTSYRLQNNDTSHTLIGGLQVGITNKQFNTQDLKYDNQYNGFYYDPSISSIETYDKLSTNYLNVHAGLKWNFRMNAKTNFSLGGSIYNITRPHESFMNNKDIRLNRRVALELGSEHKLTQKTSLLPKVLLSFQGKYSEYLLGAMIKYKLIEQPFNSWKLLAGAWGRTGDAGNLFAGIMYNNWTFGATYDINLSNLQTASNNKGGLELAIIYIWKKLPERLKFKICPKYL